MIGADSMQVEPHPPGWRTAQLCSMPGAVPQEAVNEPVADQHSGILVCHLRDGDRVFETHWTIGRGNEGMAPSYGPLDLTVYGRQEFWEDSPKGWPQRWDSRGGQFRLVGRPTAQWSRTKAGRHDDLGTAPGEQPERHSH